MTETTADEALARAMEAIQAPSWPKGAAGIEQAIKAYGDEREKQGRREALEAVGCQSDRITVRAPNCFSFKDRGIYCDRCRLLAEIQEGEQP